MNNPYFGQFLKSKLVRIYILEILKYIKETKTRRYIIFSISCGFISSEALKTVFLSYFSSFSRLLIPSLDFRAKITISQFRKFSSMKRGINTTGL